MLLGLFLLDVKAQQLNMGDELPIDPNIRIGQFDNGMTYYLSHNKKPAGMADFYIVFDVGAIQEEDHQAGLAHFLEHMAFNGTKHFPANTLTRWLEQTGLQFGTNLNAATGMEMTYYQIMQVPLKRESTIDSLLLVLHDWSGFLTLRDKDIDKERGIIIEERRQRNNAQFRISNQAAKYIYGDTRFSHRDLLGSEEFLHSFSPQLIRDFYQRWYRPDLQSIVIVGDFNVDEMEAKLKKVMASIPAKKTPANKEIIPIPNNNEPLVAVITDPEQQVCNANLYIKRPAVPKELNNRVGATYMNMLINVAISMTNIRLGELMRQPECPFTNTRLLNSVITNTCDALELQVTARGNAIAEAFSSAYGELERIRRYGFTADELEFVRTGILRAGKQVYETAAQRTNGMLGQLLINHSAKNTPLMSPEFQWTMVQLMMQRLTLEEVNELIKNLITVSNNVLIISAPEKEKASLPDEKDLAHFISWVRNAEIDPYVRETVDIPLLKEQITPGRVVKKEQGAYGATVWTLNNGIRIVILPTPYSPGQIVMKGLAEGGLSTVSEKDFYTASIAAQIAGMSGLGELNAEQLPNAIGSKVVQVQPSIERFTSSLNGSSAKSDVETMLQLSYLYFKHPRFDRSQFDLLIEANRQNIVNGAFSPEFRITQAINKMTYGDNPRAQIPNEEILSTIDFTKISEIYNSLFCDAAKNYTFYFLGDIDSDIFQPLVEKYLGGLPAGSHTLKWHDDKVRAIRGNKEERIYLQMETPKSLISFNYSGDMLYNQQNTLLTGLLAAYLQSRYTQTIREEMGGTYGINVTGTLSRQPIPEYQLKISFQTAPEKADILVKAVKEELQNVATKGPDKNELSKILAYWRKAQPEGIKNNQAWLAYLQNYYLWGEEWSTDYEKQLETITPLKIKNIASKILDEQNLKLAIIYPE